MKRGGPIARRTPMKRSGIKQSWERKPRGEYMPYSQRLGDYLDGKPAPKRRTLEDMAWNELEKLLDAEVSFWVRAVPALYSPRKGWTKCYTCGSWHNWRDLDCGHYVPRHHQGTRFDLRNVRPQCTVCNCYHEGEHWIFRQKLVEELGEQGVEAIETLAAQWGAGRHPREWLIEQIKAWRVKNAPVRKAIKQLEEGEA